MRILPPRSRRPVCIANVAKSYRRAERGKNAIVFSLIAAMVGCLACGAEPKPSDAPNFILFSIDTLRADHLGCYGYSRDTSPQIDRFAKDSIRYLRAYAPAPWTLPSHAAMLTGRHPYELGLWDLDSSIPAEVPLLAELLGAAGYQTAGFVDSLDAGLVGSNRGFGRGFENYFHSPHGAPSDYKYDVARTLDAAFAWLSKRRVEAPFFLFLHTKSVHSAPYVKSNPRQGDSPYDHPGREAFRYLQSGELRFSWRDREGNRGTRYLREANAQIARGEFDLDGFSDAKLDELIGLYDGGIQYVDREFQRLLDFLEANDLARNTVVIVTSDHGEAFLEHEFFLHQEVHRQLLQVPLIVHDPRLSEGAVIEAPVSLVDIVPSVLQRAGLPFPQGLVGRPLPRDTVGRDSAREMFSFYRFDMVSERRVFSMLRGDLRVILEQAHQGGRSRSRFYDVSIDPDELHPLARSGEVGEKLMAELRERIETGGDAEAVRIELDNENIERLRALGYLE